MASAKISRTMKISRQIDVRPLFGEVCDELHSLLCSLSTEEWHRATSSSQRQVRDIATHLLDGSLRRISLQRDGYQPPLSAGQRTDEPLLSFLNRLNSEWEQATRRLSPQVIISLLEVADRNAVQVLTSLDPHGTALFPVGWAGESVSENWFDVAREYTEKWHHTQQIFEAVGRPSTITCRRLYHPCLQTFMLALPFAFRNVRQPTGTVVAVEMQGEAGGEWRILREEHGWDWFNGSSVSPTAVISLPQADAWKVFTKRRSADEKRRMFPAIKVQGDQSLGDTVLELVSVMA
jgi:hypothetical protein